MWIFSLFLPSILGCFRQPPPPPPCYWFVGRWRVGTINGEKIGQCPWESCLTVKNETLKSDCIRKSASDPASKFLKKRLNLKNLRTN